MSKDLQNTNIMRKKKREHFIQVVQPPEGKKERVLEDLKEGLPYD